MIRIANVKIIDAISKRGWTMKVWNVWAMSSKLNFVSKKEIVSCGIDCKST